MIRAGCFCYGKDRRELWLPEFAIDRYPVTNGMYLEIAERHGLRIPDLLRDARFLERKRDHPVVGISWNDARAFCSRTGFDLPTEEEWEKAARGAGGDAYPWGEIFDGARCNTSASSMRDTTPVAHYVGGQSPFGVFDCSGNVWEWTCTPAGRALVRIKGGSWFDPPALARCDRGASARPNYACSSIGFRRVWRPQTVHHPSAGLSGGSGNLHPPAPLPTRSKTESSGVDPDVSALFELSEASVCAVRTLGESIEGDCRFERADVARSLQTVLSESTAPDLSSQFDDLRSALDCGDLAAARTLVQGIEVANASGHAVSGAELDVLKHARQALAYAEMGGASTAKPLRDFGLRGWVLVDLALIAANAALLWARAAHRL
jgi:hypothetical protein